MCRFRRFPKELPFLLPLFRAACEWLLPHFARRSQAPLQSTLPRHWSKLGGACLLQTRSRQAARPVPGQPHLPLPVMTTSTAVLIWVDPRVAENQRPCPFGKRDMQLLDDPAPTYIMLDPARAGRASPHEPFFVPVVPALRPDDHPHIARPVFSSKRLLSL